MTGGKAGIYRFRISLKYIQPEIWREIEVPDDYDFWELHVAIQDAMGWLDTHLHCFMPQDQDPGVSIGVPEHERDEEQLAGWKVPLRQYFRAPGDTMHYEYDFGDGWLHEVTLTAAEPRPAGINLPRCTAGARACPPEDCGGPPGYEQLLEILADPGHPEHREMKDWLRDHVGNYHPYDPDAFDPAEVEFWNPGERWGIAFGRSGRPA